MGNKTLIVFISIFAVAVNAFHVFTKKLPSTEESTRQYSYYQTPRQWKGRYPPDFELTLLNGRTFRLSDHIGKKAVVINFFATWCQPCIEEMPELNDFYSAHKREPFLLIGIDGGESEDAVKDFVKDMEMQFPVGIDKKNALQKKFTVFSYPTTIFIGTDGKVTLYETGAISSADIIFGAALRESKHLLKDKKGVTLKTYREEYNKQKPLDTKNAWKKYAEDDEDNKDEIKLTGRAKIIARKMDCPCGCDDKTVYACNCKTAKNIRLRLSTLDLTGKTDAEIIKMLNKEFCVKDEKPRHDKSRKRYSVI